MIALPRLQNPVRTAHDLHRAAELLGAIQRLTQPPQPAYLEISLEALPDGLSTGRLPRGGRAILDLARGELAYLPPEGRKTAFPLRGSTQAALFEDLFGALAASELGASLPPGADLFERVSRGIAARGGRYRPVERGRLMDETRLSVEPEEARGYNQLLQVIFTGIACFSARRSELKTPLVVWPEHFDLSTLLFAGLEVDESRPHLNFGFAPYSAGMEFPYLYAYAYPLPEGFEPSGLPEGARWTTEGWTGVWMDYSTIASQQDAARYVDETCAGIYRALRPALGA